MPQKKILYRLMSAESDGEKEFFGIMGKFFASMKIRRDFGYPLFDDNRMWVVAMIGDKVIGFGSFSVDKKGTGRLFDAWVEEEFRGQGIYKIITDYRMKWFIDHNISEVLVVAKPEMVSLYERLGFKIEKMNGQYAYMKGQPKVIGKDKVKK